VDVPIRTVDFPCEGGVGALAVSKTGNLIAVMIDDGEEGTTITILFIFLIKECLEEPYAISILITVIITSSPSSLFITTTFNHPPHSRQERWGSATC
jgi:hypothetical protein